MPPLRGVSWESQPRGNSGRLSAQVANVENLLGGHRPDVFWRESEERLSPPVSGDEFDFVGLVLPVDEDDRTDISFAEIVFGDRSAQYDGV